MVYAIDALRRRRSQPAGEFPHHPARRRRSSLHILRPGVTPPSPGADAQRPVHGYLVVFTTSRHSILYFENKSKIEPETVLKKILIK